MSNSSLSILVVDDTKFSSVMIGRALTQAGYHDVRYASDGAQALELLAERPAQLLLADWLMPEMDGLALTSSVRKQNLEQDNYTYIVLLTGREGSDALNEAFAQGVDDFISKSDMNEQLIPRVRAAERIYNHLQGLQRKNHFLRHSLTQLQANITHDPLTGLSNKRCLLQTLERSLRQLEGRNGTLCLLLFSIDNMAALRERFGSETQKELLRRAGKRLRRHVRPMDYLARLDGSEFALVTLNETSCNCDANSYRRLHDALNLKPFETRAGFISLTANISMLSLTPRALPVTVEQLLTQAHAGLTQARKQNKIAHTRLDQVTR